MTIDEFTDTHPNAVIALRTGKVVQRFPAFGDAVDYVDNFLRDPARRDFIITFAPEPLGKYEMGFI